MNRADYWNACFPIVASIPEPDVTECSPNVTKTNSFRRGVNNLTNLGNYSRQGDALPRRCRPAQQPSRDRKGKLLNSGHTSAPRMPSSAYKINKRLTAPRSLPI